MEKAVIYARYSSDKQTEQSIDGQIRECQKFAESKGYSIIGEYIDRALTGKVDKRPDFQRMVKDSAKGLFDYVIVYQLDRFARNRYDSAHYKHILKKNGVKVLSAKENITDDPSGILMETMLEGMAEYYSAELAQKVKRGQYEGFLKGHSSGSNCYGYDLVQANPDRNAKTFTINKAESEIIRRFFDEYASGVLIKDIVAWCKVNGIKSRYGNFNYNTIMNMLKNKKYIGTLTFAEHTRENAIPAIVDTDIFNKVQERIEKNKNKPNWFKSKEQFLLSSKAYCGYCGPPITAESGRSGMGVVYRYYKCYNKKKGKAPCEKSQINKAELERAVINATMELLQRNGMIEQIARQVVAYNDETQCNPKLELYTRQLAECEKSITNLLRAIEQGIFGASTQERLLKLESDKADLEWRIDGEKMIVPLKLDYLGTVYWFKQFASGDVVNPDFCERIIDAFVSKVIVWNDRMIIAYNVKGADGGKLTTAEIIADFEKFDSLYLGGCFGT